MKYDIRKKIFSKIIAKLKKIADDFASNQKYNRAQW